MELARRDLRFRVQGLSLNEHPFSLSLSLSLSRDIYIYTLINT